MKTPSAPFIDIFCRVIDNYGDIGVCWRLARDLQQRLQQAIHYTGSIAQAWQAYQAQMEGESSLRTSPVIRLWVDDLQRFASLAPGLDPSLDSQILDGIQICHWSTQPFMQTAWVVIETFGTTLPTDYIAAMSTQSRLWFNVEYLSAEAWVSGVHGLPSPQANGVPKVFFVPSPLPRSGGLLRENGLIARLHAFQHDKDAQAQWLAQYIPEALPDYFAGHRFISLFCYPHAPLATLCQALNTIPGAPCVLLVPHGLAPELESMAKGLRVRRFHFLPQTQFDALLSLCDVNIVRGEDSFVRALWSARPLLWHIYPQAEQAHLAKLQSWQAAFPAHYQACNHWWNAPDSDSSPFIQGVHALFNDRALREHCKAYTDALAQQSSFSARLLQFVIE